MSLTHLGLDIRCLNTDHVRGMGKYVQELLRHLPVTAGLRITGFGDRPECPLHLEAEPPVAREIFDYRGYRFHTWEQLGLPSRARRLGVQVLHCTGTTLPWRQSVPTVVTVHDTLPWEEPVAGTYERFYVHGLQPAALARARRIITISESSRRDILARWPGLESRVVVIPHGVGDAYLRAASEDEPVELPDAAVREGYALYVGGSLARKRFDWAVEVFARARDGRGLLLACGFSGKEREAAAARLPAALRGFVHFLPFVAESRMPALYRGARAVVYPTLYEGFGFPALEAQAVGTPVLLSPLGSLAELIGPLAVSLEPQDMDAWAAALRRAMAARPDATASAAGTNWARGFSWRENARRHFEVYVDALA